MGRWILEQYGLYNSVSGITTNHSEGFDAVLKRIQQWREIPVDSIVLSLYYLQAFYWNEWQRGLASKSNVFVTLLTTCISLHLCVIGLGDYKLKPEASSAAIPTDEMNLVATFPLDVLVAKVKAGLEQQHDEKEEEEVIRK